MKIYSLALLTLIFFTTTSTAAKAELFETKEFRSTPCEWAVGEWKNNTDDCIVIYGLSYNDTFNIKVFTTENKRKCIILAGDAEELNYYSGAMKIFSVALQEEENIIKNLSDQLLLKPYKEGLKADGLVENVPVNVYFSLPILERGFGMD